MPNPPSLGAETTLVNTLKESTLKKALRFPAMLPWLAPDCAGWGKDYSQGNLACRFLGFNFAGNDRR